MKRLVFLAAGMFVMGCEDYVFAGLLPGISRSLQAGVVAVAQGCAAFGIAYLLSMPLGAFLLSRRPVRWVLLTALSLSIAGNLTTLLSTHLIVYILSRFVAGLGCGLFLPVAVAAGTGLVDPGFRGRALGLMWAFHSAGAVIGVPVGLFLADRMGWRATVILILGLAVFALAGILLSRQTLRLEAAPPSLGEQLRLLVNRRVLAVIGVTLLTATGCLGLYAYITQLLAGTGSSPEVALSLWSIGGLVGSTAVGYVVDKRGEPRMVMAILLAILFLVMTSIPVVRWVPIFGLLPFLLWGAMGWATVTPQQYSLIESKAGHEAIVVALNSSAVSLGSVIGTALGGLALAGGLNAGYLPDVASLFILFALALQISLIRTDSRAFAKASPTLSPL